MSVDKKKRDGYAVLRGAPVWYLGFSGVYGWRLAVHCPFCDEVHIHGLNDNLRRGKPEHRVAHCAPDSNSPFLHVGYFIAALRPKELSILKLKPVKQKTDRS